MAPAQDNQAFDLATEAVTFSIPDDDEKPAAILEPIPEVSESQDTGSESQQHRPIKPGRQLLRWNLLFNLLVWVMVPAPLWLPFVCQTTCLHIMLAGQGTFILCWLMITLLAAKNAIKLWMAKDKSYSHTTQLEHLFVMSCYKEPLDVIATSVETIAAQTQALDINLTIGFEERTPDLEAKKQALTEMFNGRLKRLFFTCHPFGLQNEIPGKCSNVNHALRQSLDYLQEAWGSAFDAEKIIVTNCDSDTQFHPKYAEALAYKYEHSKDKNCIFQAPLFYNWSLDSASVVTRVTALLRSTLMLGALIPFNINPMSVYSFPLTLCIDGNFIHPSYQMEDIIALIRWMGVTKQSLKIRMLPVPVISGPTSGRVIEEDIEEWARQARRWTIGAAEVFHYFMVKCNNIPFLTAFSWAMSFMLYYGVLLCCSGLFSITCAISTFAISHQHMPNWMQALSLGMIVTQYWCFAVPFLIDAIVKPLMDVQERICLVRNIFQWLMSPVVLIGYSLVELFALHEIAIRGKSVCKHGASKKQSLANLQNLV